MKRRVLVALAALAVLAVGVVLVATWDKTESVGTSESPPSTSAPGSSMEVPGLTGRRSGSESDKPARNPPHVEAEAPPADPWSVTATVESGYTDKMIEGATVSLWLDIGGRRSQVGAGTTDLNGKVVMNLSALSKLSRTQLSAGWLLGHASASGHHFYKGNPREIRALLGDDLEPVPWSMEFHLPASPVIRGQVVDESGDPLARAYVLLLSSRGTRARFDGPPSYESSYVFTGEDGRYALKVPRSGTYRVYSWRWDVKSEVSPLIRMNGEHDAEAPNSRLEKRPTTTGSVRYSDGSPVADFTFEIDHPYISSLRSTATRHGFRHSFIPVRTDGLGQFEVVLPEPGAGPSDIPAGFTVRIPGVKSEDTGMDPSAARLLITLPPHRLHLLVRDVHGEPLRGQKVSLRLEPNLVLSIDGMTDERGQVSLFAPNGAKGTLRVPGARNALWRRAMEVPETGNESTILIDVPESRARGRLQFSVRKPEGEPYYPVQAVVSTLDGDLVARQWLKSATDRVVLPPGSYDVALWDSPHRPFGYDWRHIRSGYFFGRDPIQIRQGEATKVSVVWKKTAGFALRVTASDADSLELPSCRVWLSSQSGKRMGVGLEPKSGKRSRGLWTGNWTYDMHLYEPGTYDLTIEADGYRAATRTIQLLHEKMSKFEVEIERKP